MNASQQPFARLTWLTVWYKSTSDVQNDNHSQKDSPCHQEEAGVPPKDGLLYFNGSGEEEQNAGSQQKRFGLAQGLIAFVRMLSHDETMVRSVQSSHRRLVFLQPETNFYLVANIELPRRATPKHPVPTDDTIDDDVLRQSLQHGFDQYQLLHGSLTSKADQKDWKLAQNTLTEYYDWWMPRWDAEAHTLGGVDLSQYLDTTSGPPRAANLPELGNFSKRHQNCSACLFEGQQYIAQSGSSCSAETLVTLIRHISPRLPTPIPSAQDENQPRTQGASSDSIWKSTLGMGQHLGQYFTIPTVLAPSSQADERLSKSVTAPAAPHDVKSKIKPRVASAPWPKMSWDTITRPFSTAADQTPRPAAQDSTAERQSARPSFDEDDASDSDDSVAEHISKLAEKRVPFEDESEPAGGSVTPEASGSTSKIVDSDAISEALSSEMAISSLESAEANAVEIMSPLRCFDVRSEPPAWIMARQFRLKHLSLVVVTREEVDNVETLVQDARSTLTRIEIPRNLKPLAAYRYLVRNRDLQTNHALGWPTRDERWSGSLASSKEADMIGCLLQGQKIIDGQLGVSQSMIRTGTNGWSVAKRDEESKQDLYMVLPRRFGKEGSLVDASAELEKLEAASQQTR